MWCLVGKKRIPKKKKMNSLFHVVHFCFHCKRVLDLL